jgi:hypothetical protein
MKRPRRCSYQAKLMRLLVATDTASVARLFFAASLTMPNLTRIGRSGRGGIGGLLRDCYCALRSARTTFRLARTTHPGFSIFRISQTGTDGTFWKGLVVYFCERRRGPNVCLRQVPSSTRFQRCHACSAAGYYRGNEALVPDATLTRKSLENSPVPIEAVPLESSVPDDAVPGFEPPLYKGAVHSFEEVFYQHRDAKWGFTRLSGRCLRRDRQLRCLWRIRKFHVAAHGLSQLCVHLVRNRHDIR